MERFGASWLAAPRETEGEMVSCWVALERILLVLVLELMHEDAIVGKTGTNLIWADPQVYKLGLLQVRGLVSLLSSSREGTPGSLFKGGLGWARDGCLPCRAWS